MDNTATEVDISPEQVSNEPSGEPSSEPPDEPTIAEDVESGAYYTSARHWYSELFHTPIAQRSYYIFIICMAVVNVYFAVVSFLSVFPISVQVPFVTYSSDVMEDIPRINRITTEFEEDKNVAVMKYFIKSYVINRESYDLKYFELRYRNIWSQSTKSVFEDYKKDIDASNPYSYYRLYTNRSKRFVDVMSVSYKEAKNGQPFHASVTFEAPVLSLATGRQASTSRWRADFSFKYTPFKVDQSLDTNNAIARFLGLTGNSLRASGERRKVVPMTFIVSEYKVKELLE